MEELNRAEALQHLLSGILGTEAAAGMDEQRVKAILEAALEADLSYMKNAGVLSGENFYDDDDAYEAICDAVAARFSLSGKDELAACQLVEAYMELIEGYFSEKGLLDWE